MTWLGLALEIEGRDVSNGEVVQLQLADGHWMTARIDGLPDEPTVHLEFSGYAKQVAVQLPDGVRMRWPVDEE